MPTPRNNSDFDPKALTQTADEHTKLLGELQQRVGTNENFGKTFAETAKDSKSLETAIETIILKLLKDNSAVQGAISEAVQKSDRAWLSTKLKSVWGFVAAVLLVVLGAAADHFFGKK